MFQSVEKAKAALQDRGSYLSSVSGSAFSDLASAPFCAAPPLHTTDTRATARDDHADKRPHSESACLLVLLRDK